MLSLARALRLTALALIAAPLAYGQGVASSKINSATQLKNNLPVALSPLNPYAGAYSAATTYTMGQQVSYGLQIWQSQVNGNVGNTPVAGANWQPVSPVFADPDALATATSKSNSAVQPGTAPALSGLTLTPFTTAGCLQNNASGVISSGTCATGGGAAPAGTANALQTTDGAGHLTADNDVVVRPDHSISALGPRVDVRNPLFATGSGISGTPGTTCANAADPSGALDSTCAILNAKIFAEHTSFDGGTIHPVLYFPSGHYVVGTGNTGNVGLLEFTTQNVSIQGDSTASTFLQNLATNAAMITYVSRSQVSVVNMTLQGNGHLSSGSLLAFIGTGSSDVQKVRWTNHGGDALNMQGASERNRILQTNADAVNRVLVTEGNTNEDYIAFFDWTFNGRTNSWYYDSSANPYTGVDWSVACNTSAGAWSSSTTYTSSQSVTYSGLSYNFIAGGTSSAVPQFWSTSWQECGQPLKPETRPVAILDGDNIHIANGSIKGTNNVGLVLARTNSSARNIYFESSLIPSGNFNPAFIVDNGGQEIGHVLGPVTASSLTIPVDDAVYQTLFVDNPAYVSLAASDNTYALYPADYSYGSTTASAYWPGMLQGNYEIVGGGGFGYAFAGDGAFHSNQRAHYGSVAPGAAAGPVNAAVAIPADTTNAAGQLLHPVVIERIPTSSGGPAIMQDTHINMIHPSTGEGSGMCNDTGFLSQTSQWNGNPYLGCAEAWVGGTPDLYATPLPSQSLLATGQLIMRNSPMSGDTHEINGSGWIKCAVNCNVLLDLGNQELTSPIPGSTAFTSYHNNKVGLQAIAWTASSSANANWADPSARYWMSSIGNPTSQFNTLDQFYIEGGTGNQNAHWVLGGHQQCEYVGYSGNAAAVPGTGLCVDQNGNTVVTGTLSTTGLVSPAGGVNFTGGWNETVQAYSTASTYTISQAETETRLSPPSGGLTLTLPACNAANKGHQISLIIDGTGNVVTLVTGGAQFNINYVNYATLSNTAGLRGKWNCDGANWHNTIPIPEPGAATLTAGAGLGGTVTPTLTANSTVARGAFTVTSTAAGTASSVIATVNFTKTLANAPLACDVTPQNAATGALLGLWEGIPTTSGFTINGGSTAIPASTLAFGWQCQ